VHRLIPGYFSSSFAGISLLGRLNSGAILLLAGKVLGPFSILGITGYFSWGNFS